MRTALISALTALSAASAFAAGPAGRWQCLIPAYDHSLRPFIFTLKAAADSNLTGIIKGEIYDGGVLPDSIISDGKFEAPQLTFYAKIPVHGGVRLTRYTGTLSDDSTMALRITPVNGRRPPVACEAKRVGD